ncbi:restriction endonuclease subunit S [Latilactobacillus curvatus]|uniref:restriction endonuclease subunit S n=1 Tax=Latilactobacillus curvatus TaxID=28038 RepID=UPI00240F68B5|nr:restriction endonuclease subunit S [Latilactobacillus curvatus]MDG2978280.1 restriction endonuclease subunit S [Latilactobacillus curvatus]
MRTLLINWEQRDLGDITEKIGSGKTPRGGSSSYSEKGVIFLRSQNIHSNKVDFSNIVYIDNHMDYEMANSRVQQGDVLLNITGASIGRSAVYNSNESANVNQHVCIIRPSDKISSEYIQLCLVSFDGQKKIEAYQAGGGREGLNFKQISEMTFIIPFENEQKQIGEFFQKLDHTITLHQRKHDLLKKLKQGYLQQMFPVKNEVVPQLRFSGFKDDWGQSKFKNIIIRVNKSSNSNKLPKIEFEDISAGEGRLNKDISKKFDTRKGIEFEPNDILYGKLRPYLKNWLMPNFKGIALGDFWIFRSTNNISNFVYNLIQTNKYQKAANDTSGTKMPRSDWKKVSETMFFISKNLEEQQKIGEFFQKLDQDLSLQQLKIEQLQQLKQAYLQKLFP